MKHLLNITVFTSTLIFGLIVQSASLQFQCVIDPTKHKSSIGFTRVVAQYNVKTCEGLDLRSGACRRSEFDRVKTLDQAKDYVKTVCNRFAQSTLNRSLPRSHTQYRFVQANGYFQNFARTVTYFEIEPATIRLR